MAGHQRKQFVNQHIWNGQYMELQKIFQVPRKISLTFEVVNHNHQDYLCSTLSQSSESEYNSSFILLNNLSSSKESTFHSNLLISNAVSTNSKINRNLAREIEIITTKTLINIWKVLRSVNLWLNLLPSSSHCVAWSISNSQKCSHSEWYRKDFVKFISYVKV